MLWPESAPPGNEHHADHKNVKKFLSGRYSKGAKIILVFLDLSLIMFKGPRSLPQIVG